MVRQQDTRTTDIGLYENKHHAWKKHCARAQRWHRCQARKRVRAQAQADWYAAYNKLWGRVTGVVNSYTLLSPGYGDEE